MPFHPQRRLLLASALTLAALGGAGRALALAPTPRQTAGPFYPERIPLDADNDLSRVAGRDRPAAGKPVHVFGRVLDLEGRPVEGAAVEIWQCDARGHYHYPAYGESRADADFQGYGRTTSGADGGYRFRTIEPVPYTGRTPHIHFAVAAPGGPWLVTQMYLAGHPLNERDGIFMSVRDPAARARLQVAFTEAAARRLAATDGAPAGEFDLVLG